MYRRSKARKAAALLLIAASVGVLPAICANAAVAVPELTKLSQLALALSIGQPPAPEPEKPPVFVLHCLPKQEETPAEEPEDRPAEKPEPPVFTAEEAKTLSVAGNSGKTFDKAELLCRPTAFSVAAEKPAVLIVHTHTSEAYTQSVGWTYTESDPLRTKQPEFSVVRVGDEIAEELTRRGVPTLHDGTVNDRPDFNVAYARCGERTKELLTQNPSVQVVLDVHRDAQEDAQGRQAGEVVSVDGENAARIMLVVGTDAGGREHPDWRENLSLALKLQALGERRAPGLFRPIDLRRERFNQHLSRGALLVEVGAAGNTLPEALAGARIFGEILADFLTSENAATRIPD